MKVISFSSIPNWLLTPPMLRINPPVKTRLQKLPFEELSWENFERLCLRLVRLEANIEHCQLYGEHGEKQEGIDIFARQKLSSKYRVYQCKRIKNFGPTKIKSAVSKFLAGDWFSKSEMFVLCTQESFKSTKRADEIENQSKLLKKKGIILVCWNNDQLSMKLKNIPELVDDFFGREWVKAFCGVEHVKKLGKRLDAQKIIELRKKLASFYRHVFNIHDPGLLIPAVEPLHFEERYVIPDIYIKRFILPQAYIENAQQKTPLVRTNGIVQDDQTNLNKKRESKVRRSSETYQQRQTIDSWLVDNDRSIVLGGPGSGKSTLLRFICIDLLKDSPRLNSISLKWGQFLPIWIPFALWTKLISSQTKEPSSLRALLHHFLESWDEERLWPLIEQALDDDRLLLLVDGLDEWTTESAARIAFDKLRVFIRQRNIHAIITSRPHGFERLGMHNTDWQIGELSDFSRTQQEELSKIWFTHKLISLYKDSDIEPSKVEQKVNIETKSFLTELYKSSDIRELAKIPLLLCLLIYHKIHNVRLPQNRFKAYNSLIDHLILEHPQRRRDVAFLKEILSELSLDDLKMIFAYAAYTIQKNYREGLIESKIALSVVKTFLLDSNLGLGLDSVEASKLSRKIIDVGENTIGLLVKRSPKEVGFFHRAFQEYLAAYHISRMSIQDQLSIVQSYCIDRAWHEVILALFSITNRSEDINKLVDCVREKSMDISKVDQIKVEQLLCETAFGDFNCSASLTKELAQEVFKQIETGFWMPHRENQLNYALEGLRLTKTKDLVKTKLQSWFPCREMWREKIYNAMGKWPKLPEVIECLFKSIQDEEPYNKRAAARALVQLGNGDSEIENGMLSFALSSVDPRTRATAIEALFQGWPKNDNIEIILETARDSNSPELRLTAILGRIERNSHNEDDWQELIHLDSWDSGLDYHWSSDIARALLKGWPECPKTKKLCLKALRVRLPNEKSLGIETALRVLLEGYPQDQEVAEYCVNEIKNEKYPFIGLHFNSWRLLIQNMKNNPEVVSAIDEWIPNQEHNIPEIAMAALIGCTPVAKEKLLSMLHGPFLFWPAESLLKGWEMKDVEVAENLKHIALGSAENASLIGYFLPEIIKDKSECRKRLLELLQNPESKRLDFIMSGFLSLGDTQGDTEVVDSFLDIKQGRESSDYQSALGLLIIGFSSDDRVKKLAIQELSKRNGTFASVAIAYGEDENIRNRIIEVACPLPTPLRKVVSARLGEIGGDEDLLITFLKYYDHEQDDKVKTQTSISYHNLLKITGRDEKQAVNTISRGIVCYGPDYEERRQAAFCGLVSLGRLDVMLDIKETIGEDKSCSISVVRGVSSNIPLIRHVLQNWEYIRSVFGEEFWTRLSKFRSDFIDTWNEFCVFADEYPTPRKEALRFLEDRKDRKVKPNILRFLGRASPKSHILLDYCLKTLRIGEDRLDTSGENALVAAELLGEHFGGDSDILAHITLGRAKDIPYEKIILALCEGWPESDELDQIYRKIREQARHLAYPTYLNLICTKSSSKKVFNVLINELSKSELQQRRILQFYIRPVVRRLMADDSLLSMIIERIQKDPSKSEKTTLPKLISVTHGLSPELRKWCMEEIDRQLNSENPPEIGVDLYNHEVRPVVHSLLDICAT